MQGFSPLARAEELSIEDLKRLFSVLSEKIK